jgi:hypothetical protein
MLRMATMEPIKKCWPYSPRMTLNDCYHMNGR